MEKFKLLVWAVTLILGASALAEVEEKQEMRIVVAGESAVDATTFHWVSNNADFDMQGMQVGETQSIIDESGQSVLITREAEGFRFDVDGKSIVVPDIGDHGEYLTLVDGSDFTTNVDVEVMGDHHMMTSNGSSGVTIISGEALDETTKESIRAVLQSAGRDDEVTFIDGSSGSDGKHVKVIRKRVEVAQ
jgi:hypothetical protein